MDSYHHNHRARCHLLEHSHHHHRCHHQAKFAKHIYGASLRQIMSVAEMELEHTLPSCYTEGVVPVTRSILTHPPIYPHTTTFMYAHTTTLPPIYSHTHTQTHTHTHTHTHRHTHTFHVIVGLQIPSATFPTSLGGSRRT